MREYYIKLTVGSLKEIKEFFSDVQTDEYDVDVGKIVYDYRYENENGWDINGDAVADEVDNFVEEMANDEIYECISELPTDIIIEQKFINKLSVSVSGSLRWLRHIYVMIIRITVIRSIGIEKLLILKWNIFSKDKIIWSQTSLYIVS